MDAGPISGKVVDAASQTPVGGARVTLVRIVEADGGATFDDGRRTTTDADGGFVFQQLSNGRYRVDVEKSGFAPSFDPFKSTTLELGSGESITSLRVALERFDRRRATRLLQHGGLFFVLQFAASFVYAPDNVIIAQTLGPTSVARYQTSTPAATARLIAARVRLPR